MWRFFIRFINWPLLLTFRVHALTFSTPRKVHFPGPAVEQFWNFFFHQSLVPRLFCEVPHLRRGSSVREKRISNAFENFGNWLCVNAPFRGVSLRDDEWFYWLIRMHFFVSRKTRQIFLILGRRTDWRPVVRNVRGGGQVRLAALQTTFGQQTQVR